MHSVHFAHFIIHILDSTMNEEFFYRLKDESDLRACREREHDSRRLHRQLRKLHHRHTEHPRPHPQQGCKMHIRL